MYYSKVQRRFAAVGRDSGGFAMRHIVAFDGGATRTRAGLYTPGGECVGEAEGGPSNPRACGLRASARVLSGLARRLIGVNEASGYALAAGIAGAGEEAVREALARAVLAEVAAERIFVAHDLTPLLLANVGRGPGVAVIAGTGSSVLARSGDGRVARAGGWGAPFGDAGSAHEVALAGMRACAAALDGAGPKTALVEALSEAAGLAHFAEFKAWAPSASKGRVAALAPTVTGLAEEGDAVARRCVEEQAMGLAAQTDRAVASLQLPPATPVVVHGGLFDRCRLFREFFEESLRKSAPSLSIVREPVVGHEAVMRIAVAEPLADGVTEVEGGAIRTELPTELRLRGGRTLDRMEALDIVDAMSREDREAAGAVEREATSIAAAIDAVAAAFASGGRLVYVGAGTSGRLGVLDASECPPTFGVSRDTVAAIIAGGDTALKEGVEGAEDDEEEALRALEALEPALSEQDVVVGISASGTTPYVRSALGAAERSGARTVLVCCNPSVSGAAFIVIALDTGPEVVAGSTRLKAGTATKMVLNQITTGAMALSGYVYEGLMVGVKPVNAKLRRRAVCIVSELTGFSEDNAGALLAEAGDRIPVAVIAARRGVGVGEAEERLRAAGGTLRAALEG